MYIKVFMPSVESCLWKLCLFTTEYYFIIEYNASSTRYFPNSSYTSFYLFLELYDVLVYKMLLQKSLWEGTKNFLIIDSKQLISSLLPLKLKYNTYPMKIKIHVKNIRNE